MIALAGRSVQPLQRLLPDAFPLHLCGYRQDGEHDGTCPVRVVHPPQGTGDESQLDAVRLQGGGQRHEFRRVTGETLHLDHGQDDRLVRRGCLEAGELADELTRAGYEIFTWACRSLLTQLHREQVTEPPQATAQVVGCDPLSISGMTATC